MDARGYFTAGLLAMMTASVSSQAAKPVPKPATGTAAGVPAKGSQALINGSTVDTNSTPLPNTTVRLRNLETNQIEQTAIANQAGGFSFVAVPEVPYVVEVVDKSGQIIAVGDVIIAHAGEVAAATVTIASKVATIASGFAETARALAALASNVAVTVADPEPPLSPEK